MHLRSVDSLDYSGSMSGEKITAAIKNMEMVIRDFTADDDHVSDRQPYGYPQG
jgi:hypothetical protein